MKNDYGPDSGLFLRSNERGQAYQALIDYHDSGSLMGIYGEASRPAFPPDSALSTAGTDLGFSLRANQPSSSLFRSVAFSVG